MIEILKYRKKKESLLFLFCYKLTNNYCTGDKKMLRLNFDKFSSHEKKNPKMY